MAKRKVQAKKKTSGRRWMLPALLLALVAACVGWMNLQANLTHLRPATLYLEDLPPAFEDTKLLYISDLNLQTAAQARDAARLLGKLSETRPDLLILGGDYGDAAEEFFLSLADFPAPLGKFAVAGEDEGDGSALARMCFAAGVDYLDDRCATVEKGGAKLAVAGLSDRSRAKTPYNELGKYFRDGDCVIVAAHNPSAYRYIASNEARGGGPWADLVLSGHTLGGQIKLKGRTFREYPEEEAQYLGGWYNVDAQPLLVSSGYNCKGAPLRLGTRSEIWLITLKRPLILE